jgi:hypothetical protein
MGIDNQTVPKTFHSVTSLGVRVAAAGVMSALLLVIPAGKAIG